MASQSRTSNFCTRHAFNCLTYEKCFIFYLHTTLHTLRSSGSLVIDIKLEVTYTFRTFTMLFYIPQKILKICIFMEDLVPNQISGP